MHLCKSKLSSIILLGLIALGTEGCGGWSAPPETARPTTATLPPATALPADDAATEGAIRFLEERVKRDPEDFIAYNKLAGYYLQRLRETGDLAFLNLTSRAAQASLAALPAEMNAGGLAALAQVEYASHDFVSSRDHAKQLIALEPGKTYPYHILGDSLLELGDYEEAGAIIRKLEGGPLPELGTEIRLARLGSLYGNLDAAERHLKNALILALRSGKTPRETVAWCRWQLGETAFATGDLETAEGHYRDALTTLPDYFHALAAHGRLRAARGDLPGAIEHYERAVRLLPDPTFVAALGDLYQLAGREREMTAQYALVEQTARLSALNGALYNRHLALFYADHDIKAEEAYNLAAREYQVRRDIYGADAVAWTALKAGRLAEAQSAIKEALRLGTRDAKLLYHAGMIARAGGDHTAARDYLKRALALNPQFDPLQSVLAKNALEEKSATGVL